jgi:sulfite exporter TauE/SafE
MTSFVTGFLLGIVGSGHCIGMCGPLVLTLGRHQARSSRYLQTRDSLLYHGGRVLTYVALAVPAGLLGQALVLQGFGRALATVAGLTLLAGAAGAVGMRLPGRLASLCAEAAARACAAAGSWRGSHPIAGPFAAGAAHGLVPCGLVYAAITAAVAMGTAADALVLMIGFGVGTVPALIALSWSTTWLPLWLRVRLRHLTPLVLALTGALLLIRGLAPPASVTHQHDAAAAVQQGGA